MKRGYILVEGQTEEAFVKDVLAPKLQATSLRPLYLKPIIITTSRDHSGVKHRGGMTSFSKIKSEVQGLLGDGSVEIVTTMIDLYGLPEDFPGLGNAPTGAYEQVEFLEQQFKAAIPDPRFLPFLMLHEFEALLLASPDHLQERFPDTTALEALRALLHNVSSPEEINGGRDTHPSARLRQWIPTFRKTRDGPLVAGRIGLHSLRARCPHFAQWLERLEATTRTQGENPRPD